jgi:hypothetical protein
LKVARHSALDTEPPEITFSIGVCGACPATAVSVLSIQLSTAKLFGVFETCKSRSCRFSHFLQLGDRKGFKICKKCKKSSARGRFFAIFATQGRLIIDFRKKAAVKVC